MSLTATLSASTFGMGGNGGIPSAGNVVLTYPLAASASVSSGDWVKLSSTTAGTVVKCSSTTDNPIGVAFETKDNSSGAAGDLYTSVLRRGFAYVDGFVAGSGNNGPALTFDGSLYMSGTNCVGSEGQICTGTSTTAGNVIIARCFDAVPVPRTGALYKIRIYIDRLTKSVIVL